MEQLIFSDSFLDYIDKCDNKISRYLSHALQFPNGILAKVFTNKNINYITFRRDRTISFLPKGKQHIVSKENSEIWKKDNRQNGRSSATIRKIINKEALPLFKDKDFEQFANCYKQEFSSDGLRFELKSNKYIADVYAEEGAEGGSSLNSSCMQGRDSYVFDIYTHCNNLQILCLYNEEDQLCGRALVWKIDGLTIMDRIYITQDYYEKMFQEYARENDWWSKYQQNANSKKDFLDGDGIYRQRYFNFYTPTDFDKYPYIDTFTYGNDGSLTNSSSGTKYEYGSDDETRDGDGTYDDIYDRTIDDDHATTITAGRYEGSVTHYDNIAFIDGDYYYNDDDLIVEISGQYYLKSDGAVCYSEYESEWLLRDDCSFVDKGRYEGGYLPDGECLTDIDGNVWWDGDSGVVDGPDGEYYEVGDERLIELEECA